jgi:hypothetical protein
VVSLAALVLAAMPAVGQEYHPQYPASPTPYRYAYGYPSTAIARPPAPPRPIREIEDPARNRLSLFPTAELLREGEWSMTCRALMTLEFAYGARDWIELGFKNMPLLILVPEGAQNTLWSFGTRFRLLDSRLFTLTADTDGVFFLGWGGFHGRLSMRLGTDRVALHAGASGIRLWQVSDDGWAAEGDYCPVDGGCSTPALNLFIANLGAHVRVHRKVKLMLEASSYMNPDEETFMMISPAIRLHGHHFAADLGVSFVHEVGQREVYMIPLINLSVRY